MPIDLTVPSRANLARLTHATTWLVAGLLLVTGLSAAEPSLDPDLPPPADGAATAEPAPADPPQTEPGVILTTMEIPTPYLRPGAVLHSQHMTVVRFRVTPPKAGVAVNFTLREMPDPQKTYAPGTRPAMLTHPAATTDAAGIARTWLLAGEMESEVTLRADSELGARTKSVQISRTALSRVLIGEPALPADPAAVKPATPEATQTALRQIAELDRQAGDAHAALAADLETRRAEIRAALQLAVSDTRLSDDTRRWCARLLLGAPEDTPRIEFIAVLRDDRPAVQEAALAALERHPLGAVRPLQAQLALSIDPTDRVMAVRLAGFLDDRALQEHLNLALQDADPLVVAFALQFAVRFFDAEMRAQTARYIFDARPLVAWTALLLDEEFAVRRTAVPISDLARYDAGHPLHLNLESLQAIRALTGERFAAFRARALRVLPRLGGVDADRWQETLVAGRWTDDELPLLLDGLGFAPAPPREFLRRLAAQPDAKLAVRDTAALACARSTPPGEITDLFAWFSHDNEWVRAAAHQRFMQLTAHDFGAWPEAQARIVEFWREHGREAPSEWMIHAIRSKDPLRGLAARELVGLVRADSVTAGRALTVLETMVDDSDSSAQAAALLAIARLDPEGEHVASRRLAQALGTVLGNREDVRAAAVLAAVREMLEEEGLSDKGRRRLRLWEPLLAALAHRSHAVRAAAADLLITLSGVDIGFDPAAAGAQIEAAQRQYRDWFTRNWHTPARPAGDDRP